MSRPAPNYRTLRISPLAGGLNDTDDETLLGPDQSPDCLNVEFNRETIASSRGNIKFNNQVAPMSAFRTRVDQSYSPLFIEAGKAVQLRGYGYLPYASEYDIGGDFAADAPVVP